MRLPAPLLPHALPLGRPRRQCAGQCRQTVIESGDRAPLGLTAAPSFCVHGLNRGLELKPLEAGGSDASASCCSASRIRARATAGSLDRRAAHNGRQALRRAGRRASQCNINRQKSTHFRLVRQKIAQETGEPQGFVGQLRAVSVDAVGVFPAIAKGGVNGIQTRR